VIIQVIDDELARFGGLFYKPRSVLTHPTAKDDSFTIVQPFAVLVKDHETPIGTRSKLTR
jgi:hypothetical protein